MLAFPVVSGPQSSEGEALTVTTIINGSLRVQLQETESHFILSIKGFNIGNQGGGLQAASQE